MTSRCRLITALLAAALCCRAQEQTAPEDPALADIRSRTQATEDTARRRAAALYADELRLLQERLEKEGNMPAAAKAAAELRRVKAALDGQGSLQAALTGEEEQQPETGTAGRKAFRLRMNRAEFTAATPQLLWSSTGGTATWTLPPQVSGTYRIKFRYEGSSETGGRIVIRAGETLQMVTIPPGDSKKPRAMDVEAAPLLIAPGTTSMSIRVDDIKSGRDRVWVLQSVDFEPVSS